MEQNKFKDLWYDLIKIFVSFLFISVMGGFLSHLWQNREYKNQIQIEQKKYEKEAATKLFEEISKQLDRQISNFQFLINDQSFRQKCKEDYLVWNENKTRLKAMAEKYFGGSASKSLTYFSDQLKTLFIDLVISSDSIKASTSIITDLNNLEIEITNFNSKLVDDLLRDNVGSSREKLGRQQFEN